MKTQSVETSLQGGILSVTINRPEKKNAMTADMHGGFADAFEAVNRNDAIRCLLIEANGDTFCAGNDMAFFIDDYCMDSGAPVGRFLRGLLNVQKPLIAAIQGAAVGIGLTLLLHCDLVYASEDIKLSAPFCRLGLVPEACSSQLLPALIGHRLAMEIFLLGKTLDAGDALSYGLVNAVVRKDLLHVSALQAAEKITKLPSDAVNETRRLARNRAEDLPARLKDECQSFMKRVRSREAQNLFRSFLRKDS